MSYYTYYEIAVRGNKNACTAFGAAVYGYKRFKVTNNDENAYTMVIEGSVKNRMFCVTPWENANIKAELPKNLLNAHILVQGIEYHIKAEGDNLYWEATSDISEPLWDGLYRISIQECSKLFGVEVWVNELIDENMDFYHSQYKNGKESRDKCPVKLKEYEERLHDFGWGICSRCGGVFNEDDLSKVGDSWVCEECIE